tara:strand:+ start:3305 stop:4930 length:1626 start_codon:yes stop_codon:yes gene_type:complete
MSLVPEENIKKRWEALDRKRELYLDRARACAAVTIPTLLLPENYDEQEPMIQQYSSVASRGVTSLSSKILSALIPLNDTAFFKLGLNNGRTPEHSVNEYLEVLSQQIYRKLLNRNMRDAIYLALQHLVVTGNCLIIMDNDFSFRVIPLDQFVVRRNVQGDVKELIYVEYLSKPNEEKVDEARRFQHGENDQDGYDTVYIRICLQDDGQWHMEKELNEEIIDSGFFEVSPFIVLRWTGVANEDYGRSHVEDLYGDIVTLEAYSRSMVQGMAAGSTFFMGVDPAGLSELDDLSSAQNGDWVAARQQDVFVISPSSTMNAQVQVSSSAVETMRREVGAGFLMQSATMPKGERVTATAIRAIGNELEGILGGTFSAIARELMEPLVRRTILLMINNDEIDERMREQFDEEQGLLAIEIITGLQALSREGDLTKLMQLGEMVRNLPETGMKMFKWDAFSRAVVLSLGFDPKLWVKSEEEVMEEQRAMQQEKQSAEQQAQMQQILAQQAAGVAGDAARRDIQETGGQNIPPEAIQQAMQMFGVGGQQ